MLDRFDSLCFAPTIFSIVNLGGANPVGQSAIDFGLRVNRQAPRQLEIVGL